MSERTPPACQGGEQQRVGIARAVVARPEFLIADEPTGNLDPQLSSEIMSLFEAFNQVGVTVPDCHTRYALDLPTSPSNCPPSVRAAWSRVMHHEIYPCFASDPCGVGGRLWLLQHQSAAASSWKKLQERPLSTFMTWLLVALSLALPASLLLTVNNLNSVTSHFERPPQFSLLLTEQMDLDDATHLQQAITNWPEVARVKLIPRDEALSQFIALTGLNPLLESLPRNPLPHTLLVSLHNTAPEKDSTLLAKRLESSNGVDQVVLDTLWMIRAGGGAPRGIKMGAGSGRNDAADDSACAGKYPQAYGCRPRRRDFSRPADRRLLSICAQAVFIYWVVVRAGRSAHWAQ